MSNEEVVYGFITRFKQPSKIHATMGTADGVRCIDIMHMSGYQILTIVFENDMKAMVFRMDFGDFISQVTDDFEEPIVKVDNQVYLFGCHMNFKNHEEADSFDKEIEADDTVIWWTADTRIRSFYQIQFDSIDDAAVFKLKWSDSIISFHQ